MAQSSRTSADAVIAGVLVSHGLNFSSTVQTVEGSAVPLRVWKLAFELMENAPRVEIFLAATARYLEGFTTLFCKADDEVAAYRRVSDLVLSSMSLVRPLRNPNDLREVWLMVQTPIEADADPPMSGVCVHAAFGAPVEAARRILTELPGEFRPGTPTALPLSVVRGESDGDDVDAEQKLAR